MKNLKTLFLILLSSFSINAMSQTIGDYIDVVHLKNGSLIKGVIIEQIPGKTIRIKTLGGSEYVYQETEVAKFTREEKEVNGKSKDNPIKWIDRHKKKGKGCFLEAEVMYGALSQGMRITNGYRFNRFAKLGVALGMENIFTHNYGGYYGQSQIPTATFNLVFSGDILDKRITPFYQVELGYGLDVNNAFNSYQTAYNSSGFMGAAMFGVKFKTKKRIEYKLGLDVRVLEKGSNYYGGNEPSPGIRFGIGF